jgi:hypothetical protein
MNKNIIINKYIELLSDRALEAGDEKLSYFIYSLTSTLKQLKFDESDLELIKLQTEKLNNK